MNDAFIQSVGEQVQNQSDDLAGQIRKTEENLMRLKEAYLKVQGAKEMLEVVKSSIEAGTEASEEAGEQGAG
tara:strand:- start:930 stop:1145 length:216 start_codon:yes stop_codon:yes gene_type:complete